MLPLCYVADNMKMAKSFLLGCVLMAACLPVSANMPDTWLSSSNARVVDERIERMLTRISRHEQSDDRDRLLVIFKKTQKEFLHRYDAMADMDELATGDFNCLTATSLFAEILTRAGFSFKIIETNYHIFLLTSTSSGEVLIETTDRFSGFITSPEEINQRM